MDGNSRGPLLSPSLSCLTEYWSRLWQRDWASQRMLRLASWTAGTTAGEMPSPSEYKGDFSFLFKWGNGSLCLRFAKPPLLNTAKYSYRFYVCQRRREQLRRPFVMYALLCRWLLLIVISISKALIFSQSTGKHTTSNKNNSKQAFTLAFPIDFDLCAFKSNVDVAISDSFDPVGPSTQSSKWPFVAKHRNTNMQAPQSGTL